MIFLKIFCENTDILKISGKNERNQGKLDKNKRL